MSYLVYFSDEEDVITWEFSSLSKACEFAQEMYDMGNEVMIEDAAGFEYDVFSSSRLAY